MKLLQTEQEYEEALKEIDTLMTFNPELNSESGKRLDYLVSLVEKYEDIHWKIDTIDNEE
jgi:antitoxin component HigA of HigAB toxin-antitoxin module